MRIGCSPGSADTQRAASPPQFSAIATSRMLASIDTLAIPACFASSSHNEAPTASFGAIVLPAPASCTPRPPPPARPTNSVTVRGHALRSVTHRPSPATARPAPRVSTVFTTVTLGAAWSSARSRLRLDHRHHRDRLAAPPSPPSGTLVGALGCSLDPRRQRVTAGQRVLPELARLIRGAAPDHAARRLIVGLLAARLHVKSRT
jgi:hypothetical protein